MRSSGVVVGSDGGNSRKILFKLNHYLIFYTPLSCEMVVEEPVMKGEEASELTMPLKCRFCNLLRLKSFLSVYYRLDIVSRYGRLCQYSFDN